MQIKPFNAEDAAAVDDEKLDLRDATPSGRLLQAVETIGRHGALTYKELADTLGISKTATWRLVATLRDAGWVCIRQGGTRIHLDPRLDELFSTARYADAEFSTIADDMAEVAAVASAHVDLFCPDHIGVLTLHDTTRRLTVSAPGVETPDANLILAFFAAMTPSQLERHSALVKVTDNPHIVDQFALLTTRRRIQHFPGQMWGSDGRSLVVSIRGRMGTPAVFRISHKTASAKRTKVIEAFNDLRARTMDKLDMFGSGSPL